MAHDIVRKRGDTSLPFHHYAGAYEDGTETDFTGATLRLIVTKSGETTPKIDGVGTIDLVARTFTYKPTAADVDTVGSYRLEWEVTYPSGPREGPETWPTDEKKPYFTLLIQQDLG